MKKILFLILLSIGSYAQTVHRVKVGDDLQAKVNAASNGDILLIEAGLYGDITLTKRLTIIGSGYLLDETATPGSTKIGTLKFHTGSANSWVSGFQCNDIHVCVSNISISRVYGGTLRIGINEVGNDWVTSICDNVAIKQCLLNRLEILTYNGGNGRVSNFSFKNNLVFQGFHLEGNNISGEIINNSFNCNTSGVHTFESQLGDRNTSSDIGSLMVNFKNNILTNVRYGAYTTSSILSALSDIFEYNVFHKSTSYSTLINPAISPNNLQIYNQDLSTIYSGYPTIQAGQNLDARSQLAPDSPARGAGENGTDCGAFGGDDPYVLSGIPDIPSIYYLNVQSSIPQGGTLQVQIKAKTNN